VGLKLHKLPGGPGSCTSSFRMSPGRLKADAADETPKLPYLPQFYIWSKIHDVPLGPGLVPVVRLSTGKAIDLNLDSCYNED